MLKYRQHHQFTSGILDLRDKLLTARTDLEAIMELQIVSDTESAFITELLSLRPNDNDYSDTDPWPSVQSLAEQLILAWHMLLVKYSDPEADIEKGGVEAILAHYEKRLTTIDFSDFTTVVQLIMASENEATVKIKLIDIYQNEKDYFTEIASLLLTLVVPIKEGSKQFKSAIESVAEISVDEVSWQRCGKRIDEMISLDLEEDVTIYVAPQLMVPNALGMNYSQSKTVLLTVGIYFFELIEQVDLVQKRFDTIIEQTKLLSDPSRLRIVMLLRNRPMYLKELADSLGLSSATVSHHIQNLINHELLFLTVAHNNRRVNYGLRQDRFTELGRLISQLGENNSEDES